MGQKVPQSYPRAVSHILVLASQFNTPCSGCDAESSAWGACAAAYAVLS